MRPLSSTTRPVSDSETSGETGSVAAAFAGKDYYQELIGKANSVPIVKLFKHYEIRLDSYNKKTTCPFKSHKGGRERTPSFYFYSDTNSFNCYGCNIGGRCCDLVMHMDHCTRVQAAYKVLQLFGTDVDENAIFDPEDLGEQLEIMMDFSNAVREFYQTNPTPEALAYIEMQCEAYDKLNLVHKLDNEALRRSVEKIKKYISLYKT